MEYTLVRRAFRAITIDGTDTDTLPEQLLVYGSVKFTPMIEAGDSVQWSTVEGPVTMVLTPITARISDGVITHRGVDGVMLAAGGKGSNPEIIRWKATFSGMQAGGVPFTLKPVVFDAIPGGEVDLTLSAPLAGMSEPIVRGPRGVSISRVYPDKGELVFIGKSETGEAEIGRLPVKDFLDKASVDVAVGQMLASIREGVTAQWSGDELTVLGETSPPLTGPKGDRGQQGAQGDRGPAGPAPALKVGSVTSGVTPSATVTGTSPDLTLSLVLPTGPTGAPAELAMGTVTTLAPGAQATATVSGTAPNFTLDLGIPQGEGGSSTWGSITGKPTVFPPAVHTHPTEQVDGLDTALADKADKQATDAALASKADTGHKHVMVDVTDFPGLSQTIDSPGTVPTRGTGGSLAVPTTPTNDAHAAAKKYVDTQDADLLARMQARPAIWPYTGAKPPTAPAGAVVGDYMWGLSTGAFEKITGV